MDTDCSLHTKINNNKINSLKKTFQSRTDSGQSAGDLFLYLFRWMSSFRTVIWRGIFDGEIKCSISAVGMLSMLDMIGTTHAKVDISQLSAYKVAEHEYVTYEGSNGVSKLAGTTLFDEGTDGISLYHVDNQGIPFKRQYPKSHFVEQTNIVVDYELSDDGKKLLSIDKHNEIAKIWQINTDFSLTLVSEINFNTPPEAMTFVELDFQNGHYILYGQTEENTFVRTIFYWDQANDRFSQQSRLTLNNPTPTHEITFHSYPEQGLMVAISPEKLYLYQESAQGFELKLEQDFEFVSHNRIVTKLDTINNRLLVHYWKETITLELGANNKVTAVTTLPHESLFGLNIAVHDLHPTEDQLIAHTLGCLHTLNLSDTNTYTATELECNPAIYDIRDISADGNKLLMPGRGLTVADISNIDDVELIRATTQMLKKIPTMGNKIVVTVTVEKRRQKPTEIQRQTRAIPAVQATPPVPQKARVAQVVVWPGY